LQKSAVKHLLGGASLIRESFVISQKKGRGGGKRGGRGIGFGGQGKKEEKEKGKRERLGRNRFCLPANQLYKLRKKKGGRRGGGGVRSGQEEALVQFPPVTDAAALFAVNP